MRISDKECHVPDVEKVTRKAGDFHPLYCPQAKYRNMEGPRRTSYHTDQRGKAFSIQDQLFKLCV